MAKTSKIAKNLKRKKIADKYAVRRAELKAIVHSKTASFADRIKAQEALQKLPRDACPNRYVTRCVVTGRAKAVYRKFGLSRIALRDLALRGDLPGVVKASW